MNDDLYEKVKSAYQNAKLNGYDIDQWTTHFIAHDMMECESDLENEDYDEIIKALNKYRNGN